jgi:hypothetical protein
MWFDDTTTVENTVLLGKENHKKVTVVAVAQYASQQYGFLVEGCWWTMSAGKLT